MKDLLELIPAELNPLHFFLAYSGMILHILLKYAPLYKKNKNYKFSTFLKEDWVYSLISVIGIPTLLIVVTDTSLKDVLPINYVTAVFAGWQTQSMLKTLSSFSKIKNEENENNG